MTLRARLALAAILLLFIASGLLFVARPGIEVDEALLANPALYSIHHVPVMLMSYLGAFKAWLMLGLFAIVKPSAISLRTPTALLGAVAILLFFLLLDRTIGRRAAWIGALLLATDPMFVVLNAIDFGPDTLHFLWKLGAMLLLIRFYRTRSVWALAAAFFLLGLGLWDKAIFVWALFGVSLATLIVFPREVWSHLSIRNLSIAGAALIVGALPLVIYNIDDPLNTFKAGAHMVNDPVAHKLVILERTLNGSVLFGFITSVQPSPHPGVAETWFQKGSRDISEAAHAPTHTLTIWALCIACFGLFLRGARRPVLFGLLACLFTWLPMLPMAGAGGGAHHILFLWPFPYLVIAATLAQIPWKWAAALLTLILCASNLAVTNEYNWELIHNGPAIGWTDAINPLAQRLESLHAPAIYAIDWNITESLNLMSGHSLPLGLLDWNDAAALRKAVSDPRTVFITHAAPYVYFPQQRAILEDAAAKEGCEEVPLETIADRNGRPTFELFRFRKIPL